MNCYFKDNVEVVTRKGGIERPSRCKSKRQIQSPVPDVREIANIDQEVDVL